MLQNTQHESKELAVAYSDYDVDPTRGRFEFENLTDPRNSDTRTELDKVTDIVRKLNGASIGPRLVRIYHPVTEPVKGEIPPGAPTLPDGSANPNARWLCNRTTRPTSYHDTLNSWY